MSSEQKTAFDYLFDNSGEAANLRIRAKFMDRLIEFVESNDLNQDEAAKALGTTQPRVSDLLNGKISNFTIDALLNMCDEAGISVDVKFDGAYTPQSG